MQIGIYSIFLFYLFMNSPNVIGQIFGPSNYEDCIIESMEGISNDRAANAIIAACNEKFNKKNPIFVECHITWNGIKFIYGRPINLSGEYVEIKFPNTPDRAWLPKQMVTELTQTFFLDRQEEIQNLCPTLILPTNE